MFRVFPPRFMKIAKDGIRSIVKVGYDGRVHKTFRGTGKEERFENEVKVLKALEARGCEIVPRLLDSDPETLTIVTTNCGAPAEASISEERAAEIFKLLEDEFGIVHDDPFPRNITYHSRMGQFCVIDFELAQILEQRYVDCLDCDRVRSNCRSWPWLASDGLAPQTVSPNSHGTQRQLPTPIASDGFARRT